MDLYRLDGNSLVKLTRKQADEFIAGNGLVERRTIDGIVYYLAATPERAASIRQEAAAYVPERKLIPLSPLQIRLALIGAGFTMSHVQSAIDEIEDPNQREAARVSWEYASQFERHHPLIATVGAAMGLHPDDVDVLWLEAMAL